MNKIVLVKSYFVSKSSRPKTQEFQGWRAGDQEDQEDLEEVRLNCMIDSGRLALDLEKVTKSLNNEGYKILSVTPVTSGEYDFNAEQVGGGAAIFTNSGNIHGGRSYGYGFSYTDSLIVVAEKVN